MHTDMSSSYRWTVLGLNFLCVFMFYWASLFVLVLVILLCVFRVCNYCLVVMPGKTRLRNDLLCVEWDFKHYTLTHYTQVIIYLAYPMPCIVLGHTITLINRDVSSRTSPWPRGSSRTDAVVVALALAWPQQSSPWPWPQALGIGSKVLLRCLLLYVTVHSSMNDGFYIRWQTVVK